MVSRLIAILLFAVASSQFASAEDVTIVLWNGEELFDTDSVMARTDDLQECAESTKPDILLIDEVCSVDVVRAVQAAMGLSGYHVACSDFNQNDDQRHEIGRAHV